MKNKKAQITYIIAAVVILAIAAGIFIYYTQSIKTQTVVRPESIQVPVEARPVNSFYETCVTNLAKEAFEKLGAHGGYIDPTDKGLSGKSFNLKTSQTDPTESDGISFPEPVLYWYYLKTPNTCTNCALETNAPTLNEIQNQISKYINDNLDKCLNLFQNFNAEDYEISADQKRTVKTIVAENDVVINTDQNIFIKKAGKETKLEKFSVVLPFNFRQIYTIAMNITRAEAQGQLLEGVNLKIISAYGRIDSALPPIADVDTSASYKTWMKPAVKQDMQELLTVYTPYIQIANTKGAAQVQIPAASEIENKFYESMYWNFLEKTAHDISVDFFYLNWPIYFNVNPSEGQLLLPNKYSYSTFGSSPDQFSYYEFFYSVSYPVVILIKDDKAPFTEGYKFMFALESNIRCNKNLNDWVYGNGSVCNWPYEAVYVSLDTPISLTDVIGNPAYINSNPKQSLFCDESQRLSGNISLQAFDSATGLALPDVLVNFGCGKYASCPYESTVRDSSGRAVFNAPLPLCTGNAYMLLEKEGYKQKVVELSTMQGQNQELGRIFLEQLINLEVEAKIIDISQIKSIGNADLLRASARSLNENEQAMLSLFMQKENQFGQDFMPTITIGGNVSEKQNLELVSGTYNIDALLIDNNGYKFPTTCSCNSYKCVGNFVCGQMVESPDVEVSATCILKAQLSNACLKWDCKVTKQIVTEAAQSGGFDLSNVSLSIGTESKKIIFYILRIKDPDCIDELQDIGNIAQYSQDYYYYILPEVK